MQFHQRISGSTCVASIRSFQVKYFCRRSWLTSSHQRTHLRRALRADTTSASIPRLLPATGRRLAEAVEVLRQEKILAIPTDTLYGLAASASSENSIKKLYAAKQRPITVPLAICVSDAQVITKYAHTEHLEIGLLEVNFSFDSQTVKPKIFLANTGFTSRSFHNIACEEDWILSDCTPESWFDFTGNSLFLICIS
mmetsp:Transcript_5218/g.18728  ORF Transcript_5218/g.18728 Transcript_5218/m.18728 type:complete len:196 (-) Transcript_5218:1813-2400(-)